MNETSTAPIPPDLAAYDIDSHWRKTSVAARRLLLIYAHPDDESFGNAGTIARYSAAGVDVHYACGTRGENGGVKPELLANYTDLADLRSHELSCAADALGLASFHFLNYRDSGMAGSEHNDHPQALVQASAAAVASKLTALMRAVQPQVVVTFNPYGGYGHPDHIKMHEATLVAWRAVADASAYPQQVAAGLTVWQPRKLYYATFKTRFLRAVVWLLRLAGKDPRRGGENNDIDFVRALEATTASTTAIDCGDYLAAKDQAWHCHNSQLGSMGFTSSLPLWLRRRWLGTEYFSRVVPPPPLRTEHDLFAGI